MEYIH